MNISKVNFNNGALQSSTTIGVKPIPFGIYKGTQKTYYGFVDSGVYRNMNVDIYNAFNDNGILKHKLYYVTSEIGKWIKSKLKFFKEGKCYYVTKGQANEKTD